MAASGNQFDWASQARPSPLDVRLATGDDEAFLRDLYIAHRYGEFAALPWADEAKRRFLAEQYAFQHHHYAAHYADGVSLIVLHAGTTAGRLYLHAAEADLRIVDILIEAGSRGHGLGSAALRWVQELAFETGRLTVSLDVDLHNTAAKRLYERAGFVAAGHGDVRVPMTWHAAREVVVS